MSSQSKLVVLDLDDLGWLEREAKMLNDAHAQAILRRQPVSLQKALGQLLMERGWHGPYVIEGDVDLWHRPGKSSVSLGTAIKIELEEQQKERRSGVDRRQGEGQAPSHPVMSMVRWLKERGWWQTPSSSQHVWMHPTGRLVNRQGSQGMMGTNWTLGEAIDEEMHNGA